MADLRTGDAVYVTILGKRVRARVMRFVRPRAGGTNARKLSVVVWADDLARYFRFAVDDVERLEPQPPAVGTVEIIRAIAGGIPDPPPGDSLDLVPRRCPGRHHRDHIAAICHGHCCTECGGPIENDSSCRCD